MRDSSEESLLLLPFALEGHAPDALGVINKAQLLVQTNNLSTKHTPARQTGSKVFQQAASATVQHKEKHSDNAYIPF